jgi:predicted dehydrogenase
MKIGIVGTGGVARDSYLPVLAEVPDVELFYYSRSADKATAVADSFGGSVCTSLPELVGQELDTVFVLTRETQRLAAASALLEHRPKRVMFEKPLVARDGQANVCEEDFADGHALLMQAAAAGTETAMIFNYRFFSHTQQAQQIIAERGFGKVETISAHVHYACWSHCIDLITCFAGPVAEVTALNGAVDHEIWDTRAADLAAAFRTVDNATGTILGTQATDFLFPLYDLVLTFENGRIALRGLDDRMEVYDYQADSQITHKVPMKASRIDQYQQTFRKSIEAYLASISAGEPPPVPGVAGLIELQFEAGLRRSAASGAPVVLTEAFPIDSTLV